MCMTLTTMTCGQKMLNSYLLNFLEGKLVHTDQVKLETINNMKTNGITKCHCTIVHSQ